MVSLSLASKSSTDDKESNAAPIDQLIDQPTDDQEPEKRQEKGSQEGTEPLMKGQLIVLAGPSGVGKGTLLRQLRERHPELQLSISATTRQPRAGEQEGRHYYFKSRDQFHAMVEAGSLLEWAEFAGNCYGTPKEPIEAAIAQGGQVILEIELLGARQVRKSFPLAKQIFIAPPDVETLEERIRARGQETEAAIAARLAQAKVELAAAQEFDITIVNDCLETALNELEIAIFG